MIQRLQKNRGGRGRKMLPRDRLHKGPSSKTTQLGIAPQPYQAKIRQTARTIRKSWINILLVEFRIVFAWAGRGARVSAGEVVALRSRQRAPQKPNLNGTIANAQGENKASALPRGMGNLGAVH
jgi:hypothetical protein